MRIDPSVNLIRRVVRWRSVLVSHANITPRQENISVAVDVKEGADILTGSSQRTRVTRTLSRLFSVSSPAPPRQRTGIIILVLGVESHHP